MASNSIGKEGGREDRGEDGKEEESKGVERI